MGGKKRVAAAVDPENAEWLDEQAEQSGRTKSQIINGLVTNARTGMSRSVKAAILSAMATALFIALSFFAFLYTQVIEQPWSTEPLVEIAGIVLIISALLGALSAVLTVISIAVVAVRHLRGDIRIRSIPEKITAYAR